MRSAAPLSASVDQLCQDPIQPHSVITRSVGLPWELDSTCPSGPYHFLALLPEQGGGLPEAGFLVSHPWKNQPLPLEREMWEVQPVRFCHYGPTRSHVRVPYPSPVGTRQAGQVH